MLAEAHNCQPIEDQSSDKIVWELALKYHLDHGRWSYIGALLDTPHTGTPRAILTRDIGIYRHLAKRFPKHLYFY